MSASYYLTAMVNNCVPRRQLGTCSMTRPFLSLRRVWLVRLHVMIDLYRPLSEHSVPMVLRHIRGQGTHMKLSEKFSEKYQQLEHTALCLAFPKIAVQIMHVHVTHISMSTDLYS